MSIVPSLVALALVGADGAPAPQVGPEITYQVRVLEMDDIGWRKMLYHRLKPVAHQGTASVWTAGPETARAIQRQAGRVVNLPKVTAYAQAPATIFTGPRDRHYVAELGRKANGPLHRASAVGYVPETGLVREGFHATVAGRPTEQGLSLKLACDATWLVSLHTIPVPEIFVDEEGVESGMINAQLQVPEVASSKVEGEWLVPKGGVLIASLGARSAVDSDKMEEGADDAVKICERLVLIEAAQRTEAPSAGAAGHPGPPRATAATPALPPLPPAPIGIAPARPAAIPAPSRVDISTRITSASATEAAPSALPPNPPASLPMPVPPSRSLPVADGSPDPLPPLPDDQATTASLDEVSGEPRPSPQAGHVLRRQVVDPDAVRARTECQAEGGDTCCAAKGTVAEAKEKDWVPVKSGTIRIPIGGNIAVEIRATVSPAPKP